MNACVGADHDLIAQTRRLHLVNVAYRLESLSYAQSERTDRNYVDVAIVLAAHDRIFIYLSKRANTTFSLDIFDAFEVLLHVEDLNLILPCADKD